MNILITSAGRRGYIIKYFKDALKGYGGKVYAGNSSHLSTAFEYADGSVITPLIYDKEYILFLINFCKQKQIEVIISLFDVDLLILAQNKNVFQENGIKVIVSGEEVVEICNDKWKTYEFCMENNICVPKTYKAVASVKQDVLSGELKFPVVIKPRWGMGSIGIFEADDETELDIMVQKCRKAIISTYLRYEAAVDIENAVIIQEKLTGEEFGLDVINDLEGNFCSDVIRMKYAMRAGETDCAMVVQIRKIDLFAEKLSRALRHIANLDVDVFVDGDKVYMLEMNARFGGGYPFSHLAGVDLPKAIIKWINGENLADELQIKRYNRVVQKDISFVDLTRFQ